MELLLGPGWDRGLSESEAILATFVLLGAFAVVLYSAGVVGLVLRLIAAVVRGSVRTGFRLWVDCFSWAPWPVFLALIALLLALGSLTDEVVPFMPLLCGVVALFMGVTACLAYLFISLERYEVERGYKAVHNPPKGQDLASELLRYGDQVGALLMVSATVGAVGGFALVNLGLYDTFGRGWYAVESLPEPLGLDDFLAYTLVNLFRVVDLLDLAGSYNLMRVSYVRPVYWPAATLLTLYQLGFSLVILQQVNASIRQGKLLAETITDFWSPRVPIHERARNALPQYGVGAVGPLLASLRTVPSMTKEQRE